MKALYLDLDCHYHQSIILIRVALSPTHNTKNRGYTNGPDSEGPPRDALALHRGRIYILDITAEGFITRMLDRFAKKLERGHVKLYSTREYQTLFRKVGLLYLTSKSIMLSVKTHIGEKV